eukprot:2849963-Rhodomonas_salina.1
MEAVEAREVGARVLLDVLVVGREDLAQQQRLALRERLHDEAHVVGEEEERPALPAPHAVRVSSRLLRSCRPPLLPHDISCCTLCHERMMRLPDIRQQEASAATTGTGRTAGGQRTQATRF